MRFLHSPTANWLRRLLFKGARPDTRPELLENGYYTNALNMRPTSIDGNTGAMEAIGGELLKYDAGSVTNPESYVLIGSAVSQGKLMEFWASNADCIIRIDGVIVAQSPNIPYREDRPLQIAVEDRCMGGVAYPADHRSEPLYWAFDDLINAQQSGAVTFFSGYTTDANSVALGAPVEWPRLTALVDLSTNGLGTGQYVYILRYRTLTGDVSNKGPESPMFSVPFYWDQPVANGFPGGRNVGGVPSSPGAPTPYGIQMEFRVDNIYGYAEAEIIRRRFNEGGGLTGVPTEEVIARLPLLPGELSIRTHVDPSDNNIPAEPVTSDESLDEWITINAPKSVELANNRLTYANFQSGNDVPDLTFTEIDGQRVFPITQSVVTTMPDGSTVNDGYANPVNNAYLKRYMSGEKYSQFIMCWDPNATKYPAIPIVENFQFPNRRDPKTGRSFDYSDAPIYAATTDCQSSDLGVAPTYDAFSQGTFQKPNWTEEINVINGVGINEYRPWRPTGNDQATAFPASGYNIPPIIRGVMEYVDNSPFPPEAIQTPTQGGEVFAPVHHSLGLAINGVSNFPSKVRAFTVMRSAPAGRVICQGIGTYEIIPNPVNRSLPANKSTTRFVFHSPDLVSGLVPQAVYEDMQINPVNYGFQATAPLGFFSEVYGYFNDRARVPTAPGGGAGAVAGIYTPMAGGGTPLPQGLSNTRSAYGVDMLSYAGIQHDEGQVNSGEPAAGGMAYQPGALSNGAPNGNYVGYGSWRNPRPANGQSGPPSGYGFSIWHEGSNNGNFVFTPSGFQATALSDRATAWILDANAYVYTPLGSSTADNAAFNNDIVRAFHQPWYVINMLATGAEVPPNPDLLNTGMTIKLEGCIGKATGSVQTMPLVNERLDDCRPWLTTDFRYVYVREQGQPERKWICLSNFSGASPTTIINDIAANGFWIAPDGSQVYGVYEAYFDAPTGRNVVVFGGYGLGQPSPPAGSRVFVKYDNTAPIRTFGGDTTVAPSTHAVMDYSLTGNGYDAVPEYTNTMLTQPNGAPMPIGFLPLPYPGFVRSPNYYIPATPSTSGWPDGIVPCVSSIRQWCVLWDAESRTPLRYNVLGPNPQGMFPNQHYVLRPYTYFGTPAQDGFNAQWGADYPNEPTAFGGIHFLPGYNYDYARQPIPTGVSITEGIDIRTDYCNGLAASNEVDPLINEQPGLRTFLSSNVTTTSQEAGEIKFIGSAFSGAQGQNIYAWTQRGVVKLLTNKNVLTGASGEAVSTQSISNYWGEQIWLTRNIGLPDQFWRLMVKTSAPAGQGYADSFFWADRNSVWRMTGDAIVDIADDKYMTALGPTLKNLPSDYTPQMSGFYNRIQNEYWMSISEQVIPPRPPLVPVPVILPRRLFVFNAELNEWVGEFSYEFDGFAQVDRQIYGMRDMLTYGLDTGFVINGDIRVASVTTPMVGDPGMYKEAERFRVEGTRPDQIEFRNKNFELITRQNQAIAALTNPAEAQYWVLRMDSWENWLTAINIVNGAFSPTDLRPQDEFFYMTSLWNTGGEHNVVSLSTLLRNLK